MQNSVVMHTVYMNLSRVAKKVLVDVGDVAGMSTEDIQLKAC